MKCRCILSLSVALIMLAAGVTGAAQDNKSGKEEFAALFQKAGESAQAGDLAAAIETCTHIIAQDPNHVNAYWLRGQIYNNQGQSDLAMADFRHVMTLAPDFADAYGWLGWNLIQQGQFAEAKAPCQKAYELAPENLTWVMNLGHVYLLTGDPTTAREYYGRALPLVSSVDEWQQRQAAFEFFMQKGWQREACRQEFTWMQQQFETIYRFRIASDNYYVQAQAMQEQRKYLETAQLLEQSAAAEQASAQPRHSELAATFNNIGFCYQQLKQYPQAIEAFQQAIAIFRDLGQDEEIAKDLNQIGEMYGTFKEYPQAIEAYQQAVTIFRELGQDIPTLETLKNLSQVYLSDEEYANAIGAYQQMLPILRKSGQDKNIAASLNAIGGIYLAWEKYAQAVDFYQQAETILRQLGHEEGLAACLRGIGEGYHRQGQYDQAIEYYQQAVTLERKLGREANLATILERIGGIYYERGQYEQALAFFQQVLEIGRKLGREDKIATGLHDIGTLYQVWGKYDQALMFLQQELEIERTLGNQEDISSSLNAIGAVYKAWGRFDQALDFFQQALEIDRKFGHEAKMAHRLHNIGQAYELKGQYEQALTFLQQALEIDRKLGQEAEVATDLNSIGGVYMTQGQYDHALALVQQALEINRKLGREADIATNIYTIGAVYDAMGQYEQSLAMFQQALVLARKLGTEDFIAIHLSDIGAAYFKLNRYSEAISPLTEAITRIEKLRKTASGDIRRDYLASQIYAYQALIGTYLRTGNIAQAFEIIELSRAKLLAERLSGSQEVTIPPIAQIRQTLPADTAIIMYAQTFDGMAYGVITKDKMAAGHSSFSSFIHRVQEQTGATIPSTPLRFQIGNSMQQSLYQKFQQDTEVFMTLIDAYRNFLLHSDANGRGLERLDEKSRLSGIELSKQFYEFLLGNITASFAGKTKLLIVPDGSLNFLPFETLVDKDGKYLVEKYQISYAQSLAIQELLKQRQYPPDRKPLLAFGGAVYDAPQYVAEMIANDAQLKYLQKQVDSAINTGEPVGALYAQLRGGVAWKNLPGTLQEVKAIQQTVSGAEILTGDQVTEARVKNLSATGDLAQYKVLHFATHGLAETQIPELSAVVLSLPAENANVPTVSNDQHADKPSAPQEDGYLRAGEIVQLKLNADFVNLSACQTGLGKLYSGEGVVGLTQAFLLAGANGLSVSLWSVADESTARFMTALYTLVQQQKIGYAEAMTDVKRRFLRGDFGEQWQAPYYWAPFVYYGK